ncbi:GNAT family N-acetyltransferase [Pantoea pleuroti]|uniref:GNAT family N-acetyltransferase n=1 Tax=Pantoea pleuroti TaxID=1592631 RepID=UPI0015F88E55|nr:GNAT family N-acetyltransferase [Pantoea pleuroti]MBB1227948.1 GNAT family N-acetyltransferase [Pantoea pleuroti]
MTLNIREAAFEDLVLLNELGYNIYRSHFSHMWISESEMNVFLDAEYSYSTLENSLQDPSTSWYLAEAHYPIGFAKVTWESQIPETSISGVLLNKLYLNPTETGKNYGKIMFEKFIVLAQSRGKNYLWLEVLEQNERAYRFYEKQGMLHIKDTVLRTASQQSTLKVMGMSI